MSYPLNSRQPSSLDQPKSKLSSMSYFRPKIRNSSIQNNSVNNYSDSHSISSTNSNQTNASTIATTLNPTISNISSEFKKNNSQIDLSLGGNLLDNLHTSYNLSKIDTRISIDSYYIENTNQFKIKLQLTKHEIELLRYTWNKMLCEENIINKSMPGNYQTTSTSSSSSIATSLFCRQLYDNLLNLKPDLEKLFPSIKHQAISFAGVMTLTISQLENLSTIESYLEKLGKKHTRVLAIEPPNFELMGEAIIMTFHERFGSKFTTELEVLWIKLYLFLANSILQYGIDPTLKLQTNSLSTNKFHLGSGIISDSNSIMEENCGNNSIIEFDESNSSIQDDSIISNNFQKSSTLPTVQSSINSSNIPKPIKQQGKKKYGRIRKKGDCIIM
ncbi:hypothetical protein KGF54_003028 [Candida jiufengensis]|uniref:uncharacterized protein n=1 Tax=Candida jiufengensis TaxID=497108 RepID=UPI0022258397|nr:uncharacterized protein KGF54_003028 [Candida jiufengensis]KAI5953656.1 hypothetical protein KGF54_003028 [Candida jiufengensis]